MRTDTLFVAAMAETPKDIRSKPKYNVETLKTEAVFMSVALILPGLAEMSLEKTLACTIVLALQRGYMKLPKQKSLCAWIALWFSIQVHAESGDGFVPIFDGGSLKGWHASAQTGHSSVSQHKSGGRWFAQMNAIVGSQDVPGNGGILITDEQFGNFEVVLEMNNDFGPDSGLFLRSTEDGTAYQAMIDYHAGGNLMGIYGEGKLGGKPALMNFLFTEQVTSIILQTNSPVPLPVRVESWPYFWHHGEWNELRARIVNNPPTIITWINGVKFMEWTETEKRHPDKGGIALQVHGGGDLTRQFVRYRNIRVKRLD
jgi:hypothetical protein